jgi:hypothetical protein
MKGGEDVDQEPLLFLAQVGSVTVITIDESIPGLVTRQAIVRVVTDPFRTVEILRVGVLRIYQFIVEVSVGILVFVDIGVFARTDPQDEQVIGAFNSGPDETQMADPATPPAGRTVHGNRVAGIRSQDR